MNDPGSTPEPATVTGGGVRRVVVAFDFDGTLSTRDSVVPFLGRFVGRPAAVGRLVVALPAMLGAAARRNRDALRAAATAALLGGVAKSVVTDKAATFAAVVAAKRLRDDTVGRLRWHQSQGHRVVLVSASYEDYLFPIAEQLGIEAVLATRLAVDASGVCTGSLAGANCRGPEKVRRLDAWLAEQQLSRHQITLWAYGDSAGDNELLAAADHRERVDGVTVAAIAPAPATS